MRRTRRCLGAGHVQAPSPVPVGLSLALVQPHCLTRVSCMPVLHTAPAGAQGAAQPLPDARSDWLVQTRAVPGPDALQAGICDAGVWLCVRMVACLCACVYACVSIWRRKRGVFGRAHIRHPCGLPAAG